MIDLSGADNIVVHGDNMAVLPLLPEACMQLIYIDPPFNTGGRQQRRALQTVRSDDGGDRTGFGGRRYATTETGRMGYVDAYDDYLAFIGPRLVQARQLLTESGTLYFHIDWREAHYCKILLDQIFGRECFLNEVIWAYDYGGRARDRWPAKHDTILVYAKTMKRNCSTRTASPAFRTWLPAWSPRTRQRAGSCRPTCGGTPSSRRGARRRPAIRPRSPRPCCAACSSRRRVPATGSWISSRAAARPQRSRRNSAGATSWSTRTPRQSASSQAAGHRRSRLPGRVGCAARPGRCRRALRHAWIVDWQRQHGPHSGAGGSDQSRGRERCAGLIPAPALVSCLGQYTVRRRGRGVRRTALRKNAAYRGEPCLLSRGRGGRHGSGLQYRCWRSSSEWRRIQGERPRRPSWPDRESSRSAPTRSRRT